MRDGVEAGRDHAGDDAGTPPREARVTLPSETASVGAARRFLRRTLDAWGSTAMTETATLLVSELVTNAILHARCGPELVVRLHRRRLRVEVHDTSPVAPARKHYGALAGTGRGIGLVDELAADWGATPEPDGKSVWFELDGHDRSPGARLLDAETLADLASLTGMSGVDAPGAAGGSGAPPPGPGHEAPEGASLSGMAA